MTTNKRLVFLLIGMFSIAVGCSDVSDTTQGSERQGASGAGGLDRSTLPIADPVYEKITELDARDATAPPPFSINAPEGAPNVVVVLIDDIGFGAADGFGGAIATPTLDRLAADGLRFNQFHTTALCSPTRMAILTGRNHHSANTGSVMEVTLRRVRSGHVCRQGTPLPSILPHISAAPRKAAANREGEALSRDAR